MTKFRIHLIGSGTPTPTKDRFGTCFVVEIEDELVMIDCGPASTHKMVKAGLDPTKVTNLFFTHHHFDHNADYPCFVLCRWDQSAGKNNDLAVWGPSPTEKISERLFGESGVFCYDWKARVNHPASQKVFENRGGKMPRRAPHVDVFDIEPGHLVEKTGWSMLSSDAVHVQPWLNSLSYRLDTSNGSIVFAGDTEPCEALSELAEGSDVLVVNTWGRTSQMEKSGETLAMMGTSDAAELAKQAGARMLILTHTGSDMCAAGERDAILKEINATFNGKTIFGEELLSIDL